MDPAKGHARPGGNFSVLGTLLAPVGTSHFHGLHTVHAALCFRVLSFLSVDDLLHIRLTSRSAASAVAGVLPRIFHTVYISSNACPTAAAIEGLKAVGCHCQELRIRLFDGPTPTLDVNCLAQPATWSNDGMASSSSTKMVTPEFWLAIFGEVRQLASVTISCLRQPIWAGFQLVEMFLVSIREALESTFLPVLATLRLLPIHAMGLLHFRWAGGTAYRSADWMGGLRWKRLKLLQIQMINTVGMLPKDLQRIATKVLHDYLGSFSDSIEDLEFQWIGPVGPNPLFLEETAARAKKTNVSSFSAPALTWKAVRTVRLRHCDWAVAQVRILFQERAPSLRELYMEGTVAATKRELAELVTEGISWRRFAIADAAGFAFFRVAGSSGPEPSSGRSSLGHRQDDSATFAQLNLLRTLGLTLDEPPTASAWHAQDEDEPDHGSDCEIPIILDM